MPRDARGLAVTAADDASARRLDAVVAAYCGLRRDTGDRLKEAAADPTLVMAPILRGCFMQLFATAAATARAKAALAAAAALPANPREAAHRDALKAWIAGDVTGATALWRGILAHHPLDLAALKFAHYNSFYRGDSAGMRETSTAVLPAWQAGVPGRGFVLGCHAFALEECGDYDAAERCGREAVAADPADAWAAHAVAHVFEMRDRPEDGLAWIAACEPSWGAVNNFVFHARWHRCLFLLELERGDEVLARYDREVRAESTEDYLDITNAVALLWRLEQAGIDVGPRWRELADRSAAHAADQALVFADLHYWMALAAAGAPGAAAAAAALAAAREQAARGADDAAQTLRAVGLAAGEAALAHRAGDWTRVVALLTPVRDELRRIGGSHAQRDLFAQILIDAALRANPASAGALIAERLATRPNNRWGRRMAARL